MGLDDRAANGQSHAYPFTLGRKKWLKNFLGHIAAQARTAVAHGDSHHSRAIALGPNNHFAFVSPEILHSIKGIEQQVHYDLLELHFVTQHARKVLRQLECDLHIVQNSVAMQ